MKVIPKTVVEVIHCSEDESDDDEESESSAEDGEEESDGGSTVKSVGSGGTSVKSVVSGGALTDAEQEEYNALQSDIEKLDRRLKSAKDEDVFLDCNE